MSKDVVLEQTVDKVKNQQDTDDKDLTELAGYHAYKHKSFNESDILKVNGKDFQIIDLEYNTNSGMEALTVQNMKTGEYSIVYVGSQDIIDDWILTNPMLLSDTPPQQIQDAIDYYDWVNDKIGEVSSITGNSLGGALTNGVAIEKPDVDAVTLNPAILPDGMVDENKDYPNITNYFSEYDFLTLVETGINYDHRIPGDHYTIRNGVPQLSYIGSNHTGYVGKDKDGNFTITIGEEGEPGHGTIHIAAGDHIITSIWTGETLYGGPSELININKDEMEILADGIKTYITERLNLSSEYIDNSIEIVEHESEQFDQRISNLQQVLSDMIEEAADASVLGDIARTGTIINQVLDSLIDSIDWIKEKCELLESKLKTKPIEIIEYMTSTEISISPLLDEPKRYLENFQEVVNDLVDGINELITDQVPTLLEGGKDAFMDAVVDELIEHYNIIETNKEEVLNQLVSYENIVRSVANNFHKVDQNVATSVRTGTGMDTSIEALEDIETITLEESSYLTSGLSIKEIQLELSHAEISSQLTGVILVITEVLRQFLNGIDIALKAVLLAIDKATDFTLYGNPVGKIVSTFTDFDDTVKEHVAEIKEPIENMQSTVEGISTALDNLEANLPQVIENFKPYLKSAIFKSESLNNMRLYNIAAQAIFDDMEVIFDDIVYQLSGNQKGYAIQATVNVSKNVRRNISFLNEQVERVTV